MTDPSSVVIDNPIVPNLSLIVPNTSKDSILIKFKPTNQHMQTYINACTADCFDKEQRWPFIVKVGDYKTYQSKKKTYASDAPWTCCLHKQPVVRSCVCLFSGKMYVLDAVSFVICVTFCMRDNVVFVRYYCKTEKFSCHVWHDTTALHVTDHQLQAFDWSN